MRTPVKKKEKKPSVRTTHIWLSLDFTLTQPLKSIGLKTRNLPPVPLIKLALIRRPTQDLIIHPFLTLTAPVSLQTPRDPFPHTPSLKPRSVQKPIILRTRRLPRKEQPPHVRAQVLMHLQRRPGRPVRIAAVRPRFQAPPCVQECRGHGHICGAVHISQHGQDLLLCGFIVLIFDAVALGRHDGYEEDAGAGEEAWAVEGLEDGEVASLDGVGVEEKLRRGVPKDLIGRELHENFGISAH